MIFFFFVFVLISCLFFKVHGMDDEKEIVGRMNVTVSIVQALKKVKQQEQNNHRIQS
jgi:hypothetical protein